MSAALPRLTAWAASQASVISIYDTTIPGIPPADPVTGLGRYVVVAERTKLRSSGVDSVSRDASGELLLTMAVWSDVSGDSMAAACRWLVEGVQSQLVDWTPSVPGLNCGQLQQVGNPQPSPEETLTDRHLMYATDQYSYLADRIS
jgi:hypothetical protein